jgi:hypothetical protein
VVVIDVKHVSLSGRRTAASSASAALKDEHLIKLAQSNSIVFLEIRVTILQIRLRTMAIPAVLLPPASLFFGCAHGVIRMT